MAIAAARFAPKQATLGTVLTRIDPGDGVRWVELSCSADLYLVYSTTLTDGGTVPATDRHRIPANTVYPARVDPTKRMLVAGTTGTPVINVLGYDS